MTEEIEYLRERIERLESAIRRALADSESGNGWGPDITICEYLQEALSPVKDGYRE